MADQPDPYDPQRFYASATDPTKRKVHFEADEAGSSSSGTVRARDGAGGKVGSNATQTESAPGARRWYILLSLFALMVGMWAGPVILGDDGMLPRALANIKSLSSSSRALLILSRRPTSRIPPHITSYIHNAVRVALKDPVGRRDFALAAEGARIAPKLTSSLTHMSDSRQPVNILDEDLRSGSCWRFPGGQAQVSIKLPEFVYPTHVTIDHVPREIAAHIHEAPRHLVLWGILDGKINEQRREASLENMHRSPVSRAGDGPPIKAGGTFVPLAVFEYDINADFHIQTFPIDSAVIASRMYFGAVVLEVKDNWGDASTRIYRVRIHGDELDSSS